MSWNFSYQAGPDGGSLSPLSDYCTAVRIIGEGAAGKRGGNVSVPYLQGTRPIAHKFATEGLIVLEVALRYTNSAGAITDPDGEAGHVFANLSEVKRLLTGAKTLTRIQRTAPNQGAQYVVGEVLAPIRPSQARHIYGFPISLPRPAWISTTENSQTPTPSVTVGGDFPVDDPIVEFVGGTNPVLTHTASGATLGIDGAVPAGGVRVFVGEGRAELITGGTDATALVSAPSRGYWLELDPGQSNAFSATGGSTITLKWRNQWRTG